MKSKTVVAVLFLAIGLFSFGCSAQKVAQTTETIQKIQSLVLAQCGYWMPVVEEIGAVTATVAPSVKDEAALPALVAGMICSTVESVKLNVPAPAIAAKGAAKERPLPIVLNQKRVNGIAR